MTTYLVNGLGCCFGEELEGDKDQKYKRSCGKKEPPQQDSCAAAQELFWYAPNIFDKSTTVVNAVTDQHMDESGGRVTDGAKLTQTYVIKVHVGLPQISLT